MLSITAYHAGKDQKGPGQIDKEHGLKRVQSYFKNKDKSPEIKSFNSPPIVI